MNGSVGSSALCFIGAILVIAFFFLATAIRIVPAYQRLVVFRLGRPLDKPKGPGIVFLMPLIDRSLIVDLREQKREVFAQKATTKDFIPASFDFRWYYKILDPIKAVLTVANTEATVAGIISTKLRTDIHEINSASLSSEQERISYELIHTDPGFRESCEQLGVIVTQFEILKLALDDQKKQMNDAKSTFGTFGETQTTVHTTGTVIIGNQTWDAMSNKPIAPKTKVRVKRVVLEVEESRSEK